MKEKLNSPMPAALNKQYPGVRNLFISFSGGKTSALMTKLILDTYKADYNIVVVFANTGQEHPKTLEFIDRCDREFNLGVHWVESVVHHGKRKGCTSKRVDYATACRGPELFEEMIKKYGIPNMSFPHCTRELKTNPLHHYVKSVFGEEKYITAIGIRFDEMDRINPNFRKLRYAYPLLDWKVTKDDVNKFWRKQSFTLEIPEHLGNCTWCWKKTLRKHMAIMDDLPEAHKVPERLEALYPHAGAGVGPRVFFRKNQSTKDLRRLYAEGKIIPFEDTYFNDCKESCEAF